MTNNDFFEISRCSKSHEWLHVGLRRFFVRLQNCVT